VESAPGVPHDGKTVNPSGYGCRPARAAGLTHTRWGVPGRGGRDPARPPHPPDPLLQSDVRTAATHLPHWQTHRSGTPTPARRPAAGRCRHDGGFLRPGEPEPALHPPLFPADAGRDQLDALEAQLADREAYLTLAHDLEGFNSPCRGTPPPDRRLPTCENAAVCGWCHEPYRQADSRALPAPCTSAGPARPAHRDPESIPAKTPSRTAISRPGTTEGRRCGVSPRPNSSGSCIIAGTYASFRTSSPGRARRPQWVIVTPCC
jgi:hypothetical protein